MASEGVILELLRQDALEKERKRNQPQVDIQTVMQGIMQGVQLYDAVKGIGAKYGSPGTPAQPGSPTIPSVTQQGTALGSQITPRDPSAFGFPPSAIGQGAQDLAGQGTYADLLKSVLPAGPGMNAPTMNQVPGQTSPAPNFQALLAGMPQAAPSAAVPGTPAIPPTLGTVDLEKLKAMSEVAKAAPSMASALNPQASKITGQPADLTPAPTNVITKDENGNFVYTPVQGKVNTSLATTQMRGMTAEEIAKWKMDNQTRLQSLKKNDSTLSPADAHFYAAQFRQSGQMPALGLGSTPIRMQILHEARVQADAAGQTGEIINLNRAMYSASSKELANLQKNRGQIEAFEKTASKNLDVALNLSQKVDRTGVPVVNRWLLAGKKSLQGDPDVSKFDAAVRTGINEYSRVVTSATGGAVTSDTARKEVESMLNSAQTPEQIQGVIQDVLKVDMQNRIISYDEQIKKNQEDIKNVGDLTQKGGKRSLQSYMANPKVSQVDKDKANQAKAKGASEDAIIAAFDLKYGAQ